MSILTLPGQSVGDFSIVAISDGYLTASLELLSNIDSADAAKIQSDAGVKQPDLVHINCYLVRGRGRTILIDAGAGGLRNWGGHLTANLGQAGVKPSQIDTILLTHAHPDHVGGLVDASGTIAFPDAELVVHRREVAFWQDDGNLSRAAERARGNFHVARQAFHLYRAGLRTFEDGEVLPGIRAMPFPGHTAGHSGYLLESRGRNLLVWGDIVHFPHIQVTHPNVSIAFDQDPALAAKTRSRLLDQVSSEQLLIAGMHLGELGFARIKRTGTSYRFLHEPR